MSKLPWNSYAGQGPRAEEGGMEHLETDVMRFMAILAFCLVAIFALVQSMPLESVPATPPPAVAAVTPAAAVAQPEPKIPDAATAGSLLPEPTTPEPVIREANARPSPIEPEPPTDVDRPAVAATPPSAADEPEPLATRLVIAAPVTRPRPEPDAVTLVMPEPEPYVPGPQPTPAPDVVGETSTAPPVAVAVAPRPAPAPAARSATPEPVPPAPAEAPTEKRGFSLRFDSDDALRQLVSRDEVALYAIANRKAWRVMLVNERLSFRPAQTPSRFHEMAAETVPDDVVRTLRRLVTVSPDNLTWGVTLPAATSRQLSEFISAYDSGGLVIGADGALRLERG